MQLGNENLGDECDEGKEPSSSESRVGAVVGVERCNLGMQILATSATKAKRNHRWSRVWERWWAARSGPRFGPPWFLLLAGYENLTAPLFALARQCKAEVTVAVPGGSPYA
jgi:hypothetical protein